MPSREPGEAAEDPAAELLGRWQAHHDGDPDPAERGSAGPESPRDPAPAPGRRRTQPTAPERGPDGVEVAREVVDALGLAGRSGSPAPSSTPAPEPGDAPRDGGDGDDPRPTPHVAREAPSSAPRGRHRPQHLGRNPDVAFAPRLGAQRAVGVLLLGLLVGTGAAGYWAYDERTTLSLGLAGTLGLLTLLVWAVRAGSAPATLAIRSGQLEVVRGSKREVFDLTSRYTRVQEVGTPGRRGWKVLLGRFGRDPLVIDSSMVDPHDFSDALARFRPRD